MGEGGLPREPVPATITRDALLAEPQSRLHTDLPADREHLARAPPPPTQTLEEDSTISAPAPADGGPWSSCQGWSLLSAPPLAIGPSQRHQQHECF